MTTILKAIARIYEKSASGRHCSTRDYTIDYEKFLRSAKIADGDEREMAERELREAETKSNGLFQVDRHPRSRIAERLRLSANGGEAWLFEQIGETSPTQKRAKLANDFQEMATAMVPERWQQSWLDWFDQLSRTALIGGNVHPFRNDDYEGNQALTDAIKGVLCWQGASLIRYASTAILGDSKQLGKMEARLRPALAAITGSDALEDFGILQKPRFVMFHGPLEIRFGDKSNDFSIFGGPIALSETNFSNNCEFITTAPLCLTIENEDTFHELTASNPGILLVLTSYAGSAVRRFIDLLPQYMRFLHFGDSDPAGSDILRDLREKSGRDIHPLLIPDIAIQKHRPLMDSDHKMLKRLLESDLPDSLKTHLGVLLEQGIPVNFEQEGIPIHKVWEMITRECSSRRR